MTLAIQIFILVIGFIMMIKGADWFVEGASSIADRLKIPQLIIGLTIVAMGTSTPEAAVSITAALKGNGGISIGNIVGSNILNILLILGITSLISTLTVQASTLRYEIPYVILITIVLLGMGMSGERITFWEAIILLLLMIVFLVYLFHMAKKGKAAIEEEEIAERSFIKSLFLTLIGLVLIVLGSQFSVDAATKIAEMFGISQRIIGLTIIAFGTSLPELITSVIAAMKGKDDIAVGNIVGSNIFNILFVLGVSGVITTITFEPKFILDTVTAILAALLLLFCVWKDKKLKRFGGILMLTAYAVYFVKLMV